MSPTAPEPAQATCARPASMPAAGPPGSACAPASPAHAPPTWDIVGESILHKRYLSVMNRTVRFSNSPHGQLDVDFDVVGHHKAQFKYSIAFPFHPYTDGRPGGEVTLIREYAQGPNRMLPGLPAGAFEPAKHAGPLECAQAECAEEAHLVGGRWVPLLPADGPGCFEVKWCANAMFPFLVLDPQPHPAPPQRDVEEHTMEVLRVPVAEVERLLAAGGMLLPSMTTCYMALAWLRAQGMLA